MQRLSRVHELCASYSRRRAVMGDGGRRCIMVSMGWNQRVTRRLAAHERAAFAILLLVPTPRSATLPLLPSPCPLCRYPLSL